MVSVLTTPFEMALKAVRPFVPISTSFDILKGVRITCDGDGVFRVTVSNLDVYAEYTFDINVSGDIDIVVPFKSLFSVIDAGKIGDDVDIVFTKNRVAFKGGKSNILLPVMNVDDFPLSIKVNPTTTVEIPAKDLKELFSRVQFAIDYNSPNKVFRYIKLSLKDGNLIATATNTRVLSEANTYVGVDGEFTVLISNAVASVVRSFDDDDMVIMDIGDNIAVKCKNMRIACKKPKGSYPNTDNVFNSISDINFRYKIKVSDMLDAIKTIIVSDRGEVRLEFGNGKLNMVSGMDLNVETGIDVEDENGNRAYVVFFNKKLLHDILSMLKNTNSDEYEWQFVSNSSATLIKPVAENIRIIVMPMLFPDRE
jgi:DNA polymerase III sliding clamp (beta) subunit (PCNA family)